MTWAQRLKRVFAIDIETCPDCGGKQWVIACIEDPPLIAKILWHIQQRAEMDGPLGRNKPRRGGRGNGKGNTIVFILPDPSGAVDLAALFYAVVPVDGAYAGHFVEVPFWVDLGSDHPGYPLFR
jgi:hypothetical protein